VAVAFKDYYTILGIDRGADAAAIKKAYRRKARELHPDRNKAKGSEDRFREVNEAYEVLGDPEKRARYDQLGANWQGGMPFEPPPGFEGFGGGQGYRVHTDFGDLGDLFGGATGRGGGGFSDFFQSLFGDMGLGGQRETRPRRPRSQHGQNVEAEVEFSVQDLLHPGPKKITLGVPAPDGGVERKTVTVNVPAGLRNGQKLRLPGHGSAGVGGAPAGDIYLRVRLRPEPNLALDGDDLVTDVDLPAPVAVVGGTVRVASPEGPVTLRVKPGTQTGTTLRVRGRGLPKKGDGRGDLLARLRVVVPERPTEAERRLYQQLADLDSTDRGGGR
jgi:curved DNA-binding protein